MARVLIIEDDDQVAQLYAEWLRDAGHEPERSATAYGAAQLMIRNRYDLVLVDLLLQGSVNGVVAALALRGLGYAGPVVVVTGGLMAIDDDVRARAGFARELRKPLLPADLLGAVAEFLPTEEST